MFLFLMLVLPFFAEALSERSCEEIVTSEMKMKLVRDSLNQVKVLFPACKEADEELNKCSKRSNALAHLNLAFDTLENLQVIGKIDKVCPVCPDPIVGGGGGPIDCQDILDMGNKKSGIYTIFPKDPKTGTKKVDVFCDMETDGGGWTVFQRRGNFSSQTNFHQDWETYKKGFGNLETDFWLGNQHIYAISNQAFYSLRIDAKDVSGEYRYNHQEVFFISDEESGYILYVYGFSGNTSNPFETQHKRRFSTKDRPHEGLKGNDVCATIMHGAWWYPPINTCGHLNLNGLYMPGINNQGSNWHYTWTGYKGLLFSEMKVRRKIYDVL